MSDNKRSYYRNWYQHWQMEKAEEEKLQAMKYYSEMQEEEALPHLDIEVYRANHELSRKNAGPSSSNRIVNSGETRGIRDKANANGEIFRKVMIVFPLVLVVLTFMYSVGFIPQTLVDQFLNGGKQSSVMTYIALHDEIMVLHNEINLNLERHVPNENLTSEFQQELNEQYERVLQQTEMLMEQTGRTFANLNRLWSLKVTSLNEMVSSVLNQEEVTPEVLDYYHQFVEDQNEIGKQITLALTNLLFDHNIEYIERANGDIELVG